MRIHVRGMNEISELLTFLIANIYCRVLVHDDGKGVLQPVCSRLVG